MTPAAKLILDAAAEQDALAKMAPLGAERAWHQQTAETLRALVPAIEAATQTSELDDACAFLEPEKLVTLLKKAPRGQSTWMISREIAPTLAEAIIATARALGWKPRLR